MILHSKNLLMDMERSKVKLTFKFIGTGVFFGVGGAWINKFMVNNVDYFSSLVGKQLSAAALILEFSPGEKVDWSIFYQGASFPGHWSSDPARGAFSIDQDTIITIKISCKTPPP